MKLLIVEDESSLRELLARALRKEQYVVETASTYAEASDKLAAYSYDCILLDIMLPDGNGLQLLERLRRADKRENVIIISARDSLEDKVLGLKEGAETTCLNRSIWRNSRRVSRVSFAVVAVAGKAALRWVM